MTRRNEWFFSRGDLAREGWESVVDDRIPGWHHTGLRIAELTDEDESSLAAGSVERLIIPLHGSFTVSHDGSSTELAGRPSVFAGPTDVLYLGTGTAASIRGRGRVAVAEAPASVAYPARHIRRDEVPVELRGAGRSSRQVHNFGTPQTLAADRFIVCEVITPAENWSSYPPHKHDVRSESESRLEEIYYFESAVSRSARNAAVPSHPDAFGYLRTYSSEAGEIDTLAEVRTGDIGLVPHGWHGPCMAAPGYDLYYLNVMAGPDPERVWNISDDPAHGWVRATWEGQEVDPRLPYLPATDRSGDHR
ncbi:5-deoxy-glucuronate isomerase [Leifsonia sp. 1010]|uniref:5-deoxy-glucuronate isomerase n=1 Tax=Leifsonia sp. 1010 TaxID=2817769 RepID=UPI0028607551|nr:5-deoxy-glucuronate isomerase [Leifsonia sp. 1010]MDR6611935.1 5-deoxy-glucuronate isomerase [Leifsonia sp. 1010]